MALYFEGYSQSAIANKLNVDQSTVSLYLSKFKSLVDQQGIKAAGEEFDIMNIVDALHSLAAELKKSKLTVEEAKVGLKMMSPFQKLGVKAEDYQDVIQAAIKLKTEGFLESAVELNKLEESTGMTHEEIVAQSANTCQQLKSDQQDLEIVTGALNAAKEDLVAIENQKQLASQDLLAHMQQIGIDMNRLALVEELAARLKKSGVSNDNLKDYIQRQQLLNEAGISIGIFVSILEKTDVVTSKDHGEGLFQMLAEYGSLSEANKTLETKAQLLEKETSNLDQRAQLKGEIEGTITELKTEKTSLEAYVSQLYDQKNTLDSTKSDISSLAEKKDGLEQEIVGLETYPVVSVLLSGKGNCCSGVICLNTLMTAYSILSLPDSSSCCVSMTSHTNISSFPNRLPRCISSTKAWSPIKYQCMFAPSLSLHFPSLLNVRLVICNR